MKKSLAIIGAPPFDGDAELPDELAPDTEWRTLILGAQQHGARLDVALAQTLQEFSRNYLRQLLEMDGVRLNGQAVAKPATRVKAGDRVEVGLRPTPQSQAFRAEFLPLNLAYEDQYLLVIDKPAGWVVHPAPGNWSGTVMNALLGRDPAAFDLPRAGIVHRLDKDTSGLMVVARTRPVMDALVRALAAREVKRQYLALAHRPWQGPSVRTVHSPIGRDPHNRLRMAVVNLDCQAGKPAHTDLELLANAEDGCLVRCTLHTGRTHQIRVHLAALGHPLLADAVYGGRPAAGMQRQALHATRLAFVHPVTGQTVRLDSPLPEDMCCALSQWRLHYNAALSSPAQH